MRAGAQTWRYDIMLKPTSLVEQLAVARNVLSMPSLTAWDLMGLLHLAWLSITSSAERTKSYDHSTWQELTASFSITAQEFLREGRHTTLGLIFVKWSQ